MKDLNKLAYKSNSIINFSKKYFNRLNSIYKSVDKKIHDLEKILRN